ncbi:glycosyltransferase [Zestomonas carbonaria]|nr:glycosyltransferase [Pseudomonas carbonaria]
MDKLILVGSKISGDSIQGSLGKPEYSYYFLMRDFIPALQRLGTVVEVSTLEEVDELFERHDALGREVVFLSFSPPQQTPLGLRCPTVAVFAWEFDSLPSVAWDSNPQNDWRYAFARMSGAISTSREAAALVEEAAGARFPVVALPAPVWDRHAGLGSPEGVPLSLGDRQFSFRGVVIDSPILGLSADGLVRKPEPVPAELPADPEPVQVVEGRFAQSWQLSKALLRGWWAEVRQPLQPACEAEHAVEASSVKSPPEREEEPARSIRVDGVVYTTILNPADSRKNWVELITAFCWAFKETEDATLIVKMTHHDLEYYRIVLMTLLSRLAPFRCRVLVLHGFLEDSQYRELIDASTYYVNASSGEGLCLPLMEFLSAGRPAIAPVHTAMADYVDERLAFLLKCSPEPFCWPHDPTGIFMTHRHRLNWQSLMEAYKTSYEVATADPWRYRQMSAHAFAKMRAFASVEAVAAPLDEFLEKIMKEPVRQVGRQLDRSSAP